RRGQRDAEIQSRERAVQPFRHALQQQPTDEYLSLELANRLCLLARARKGDGRQSDPVVLVREAADLLARQMANSANAPYGRHLLAKEFILLSNALRWLNEPLEGSLRAAERARRLYEDWLREAPGDLDALHGLSEAWTQIAKVYWRGGQPAAI